MFAKQITDTKKFYELVAQAVAKTDTGKLNTAYKLRWINAVAKAAREIEENGEFMDYKLDGTYLDVWSQTSNRIYSANGVCQCQAYKEGMARHGIPYPCWHRAAARIFRIYFGLAESHQPLPREAEFPRASPPSTSMEVTLLPNTPTRKLESLTKGGPRF